MTGEELLQNSFVKLEVNQDFTEAVFLLRDRSRLCFCHRVGERWAKAVPSAQEAERDTAGQVMSTITMFRLNGKHLDIQFADGSRWERRFGNSAKRE